MWLESSNWRNRCIFEVNLWIDPEPYRFLMEKFDLKVNGSDNDESEVCV
jgi:hypothetical protein